MLFTSSSFLDLFVVTFVLYYLRPLRRLQVHVLVVASLVFYGWSSPQLLVLLASSIALNAITSLKAMDADLRRARAWLTAGVVLNLATLAFFKYAGLIVGTLRFQGSVAELLMKIPLPIGISFFTFEGISLCVDAYRGRNQAEVREALREKNTSYWLSTTLFVSFFPHLIAGPILKARHFFPQIVPKRLGDIDWESAFRSLVVGYFLKMFVADNLRSLTGYMTYPLYLYRPSAELVGMLFGFSMQIFADFAGYSLIAIGLAKLFGYQLPDNFDFPYISESFSEFWRRWHISLSSWLREYLYVPLGGNRKGTARTYLNLFMVMFLGGLWHGAAWSYAVWGTAHGAALAVERFADRPDRIRRRSTAARALRIAIVFGYVTLAWLLFKLTDIRQAFDYLRSIGANRGRCPSCAILPLSYIFVYSLPVVAYHLAYLARRQFPGLQRRFAPVVDPLALGAMLFLTVTNFGGREAFIYFQF
jgi:alginate O-acetyltransferase complex protein AlgI